MSRRRETLSETVRVLLIKRKICKAYLRNTVQKELNLCHILMVTNLKKRNPLRLLEDLRPFSEDLESFYSIFTRLMREKSTMKKI